MFIVPFVAIPTSIKIWLTDSKNHKTLLWITALVLIVVVYFSRLWLLQTRKFDPDEFEHLHSAWLISQGFLPFKDYFEHHTPAMHFLLAQFFSFFDVEANFREASEMLFFSRRFMWVLTGIILIINFKIGQQWRNWRVGIVGTVFLVCTVMFQTKTLEIRPDLLSIPCWLGCLFLLMTVVQSKETTESRKRWLMFICGVLLGTSIMATQKMLFAMPGFTIAMIIYWFNPNSPGTVYNRFIQILCQMAGFFSPILITLGYFGLYDAAYAFIEYNLLLNLGWKVGFSPFVYIVKLLSQNPFLVGLGLFGLIGAIHRFRSTDNSVHLNYIMIINLIGLVAGLFIIPVPWRQYYLMFLPLLALFAANALIEVVDLMIQFKDDKYLKSKFIGVCLLYVFFTAGMLLWTLPKPGEIEVMDLLKMFVFFIAILLGLIPIALQRRDLAVAFLIVALHLPTAKKFTSKFKSSNAEQLASIQYVIENSSLEDTFMDGWMGVGLFRPHAYFYWMLHVEIRHMISDQEKNDLLKKLQSGHINPKLVNLDDDLRDLSPEITSFILENYLPVGVGSIYKRNIMKD